MWKRSVHRMSYQPAKQYVDRLESLLKQSPIIDTHNDFPYLLRTQLHNELHTDNDGFKFTNVLTSHTDLPKMKAGKIGIQFFSCYLDCPEENYLYQDFNLKNTMVRDTLEQIDVTSRVVNEYSQDLKFVETVDEALHAYHNEGKIAIALGVEGLHQCDTSLGVLRQYFKLGVRYITLTHNCDNPFATAASSITHGMPDRGLTEHGVTCVREMNRLGMLVDLSHVSYKTMKDVLEIAKAPVIFSHSSAYTLTNHERNVRDDVLLMVKANSGVVQVNFYPSFITPDNSTQEATIDDAVNHIFHIAKVAGWEHVGFGADFDGVERVSQGLEDVSKYPDLIYKCMERGATDDQIKGLMGANLLRVWRANEQVAKSLQAQDEPINEKEWPGRRWEFPASTQDMYELYPGSKALHRDTTVWKDEYFKKE